MEHEQSRRHLYVSILDWAVDHHPETALALTSEMALYWSRKGYGTEGRRWIQEALAAHVEQNFTKARKLLKQSQEIFRHNHNRWFSEAPMMTSGMVEFWDGNFIQSRQNFEEALSIFQEAGDQQFTTVSLSWLADLDRVEKQYCKAAHCIVLPSCSGPRRLCAGRARCR